MVVDGSSRAPRRRREPSATSSRRRSTPTTAPPRERADRVGKERGAEHGQDEATRVEDAAQRQPGRPRSARRARTARRSARARCHAVVPRLRCVRTAREAPGSTRSRTGRSTRRPRPPTRRGVSAAGWVSTTTTPMPASEPSARSDVGRRPGRAPRSTRSTRRCVREVLEHDRQPVAVVGPDGGERSTRRDGDRRRCRAPRPHW